MSAAKRRTASATRSLWVWVLVCLAAAAAIVTLVLPQLQPEPPVPEPTLAQPRSDQEILSEYAGSKSCQECHAVEHQRWIGSNHQLAERAVDMEQDRTAFEPTRAIESGWQNSVATVSNGVCVLLTPGFSGELEPVQLEGVIGVTPLRQFLAPFPRGRFQAVELAYDPHAHEWFDIYGNEDRRPGEWGHWTGRGMNWNSMCASCHNTRLLKNYQSTNDSYQTIMAERSVGCEACHGPMKAHVDWQRNYPGQTDPALMTLSTNQILDTCGSCHSRRSELTGNFTPGELYADHYALVIPDETELYYADGQVHDEDYVFTSFLSSGMHRAGVRCLDCHDPHTTKIQLPGNQLCMRCHNGSYTNSPLINPVAHSFHALGSPGAECVNCHMPQTVYMGRHPRRDHGFTIPDPLLTIRHGVPNACNRCHTDQDPAWALAAVEKWYGARMDRPTRQRAEWIAAARQGEPSARGDIVKLLRDDKASFWQAVAAGLLHHWAFETEVTAALVSALEHPDSLVRANAARSLESVSGQPEVQAALRRRLNDPVRAVRIRAGWALRGEISSSDPAAVDLLRFINFHSDQPTGLLQRSAFLRARKKDQLALDDLLRAVTWDPNSAPLRHELAVLFSVLKQPQAAIEQLQQACQLEPAQAEYRFKLALAYNEAGQLEKTIEALQEAVRLEPAHARAWYNLGLGLFEQGQPERALEALAKAESLSSQDPTIPYARATILTQIGRTEEARLAAVRTLELEPNHELAGQLLQVLGP